MEPQIRYVRTSDGVRIATHRLGEGAPGVPLVVVPPYFLSAFSNDWRVPDVREGFSRLAERRLVVNYDPRGYGLSDRDVTDFSMEARVADLAAVIDSTRSAPVNVLSRGPASLWAIMYAAANPLRVGRLVLSSGLARMSDFRVNPERRGLGALVETNWKLYLQTMVLSDFGWDVGKVFAEGLDGLVSRDVYMAAWRAQRGVDVSDFLPRVRCPALVTYGRSSHWTDEAEDIPIEAARRLAADLPDARLKTFTGGTAPMTFVGSVDEQVTAFEAFLAEGDTAVEPDAAGHGTAVVLFADIADSTAMTERMGDAAFRAKARELDAVLRAAVRDHGGGVIDAKTLGDGILATFAAAAQAVRAAVACAAAGEAQGLPLHVGLHAGDVIREDGNVFGGAVNIAARVSALAAPGEVLVSGTVRELARTSAGVAFEDRGEHELKGVADAVRVYAVRRAE